jgi:hypothetical protein
MIDLLDDFIDETWKVVITIAMLWITLPIAINKDQRNLARETVKRTYH